MRAVVVVFLWAAACGDNGLSTSPSACTWPAQYDETDAGASGHCIAARYELSCTGAGVNEGCLSPMRDACPPQSAVAGAFGDCTSECHDDEYAMWCGFGPNGGAEPPSSCRFAGAFPSGTETVCCPCGS